MYWNVIQDNSVGLRLENVSSATIWNNTFSHNTFQVVLGNGTGALAWDRGGYGNYWSDYTGVDSDGDGIGDTPYVVAHGNIDHYPLLPHAEITSASLTVSGDRAILSVEALVSHPTGTWNLTVKTPTGEPLATRTFNITRTPYTIRATLELPPGEPYYTVHLATANTSVAEKSVTSTSTPSTSPERGENPPTTTRPEESMGGGKTPIAGLAAAVVIIIVALAVYLTRLKR